MKYKVILEEGKEATISAECLGDAHIQAIKQWGTSVSGIVEWDRMNVVASISIPKEKEPMILNKSGEMVPFTPAGTSILEAICEASADWNIKHRKIGIVEDGLKHDNGKHRWDLLPIAPIEAIIRVLEHGAVKYGIDNWRDLKSQETRIYAAALRHLTAWKKGEKIDPESGLSHLAHAACNLVFMLEFKENEKQESR